MMKLGPPKQITFWISVVLAVIGVLASLITIPVLSGLAIWLVVIGFVLLAAGNLIQGLWISREGAGLRELVSSAVVEPGSLQLAQYRLAKDEAEARGRILCRGCGGSRGLERTATHRFAQALQGQGTAQGVAALRPANST